VFDNEGYSNDLEISFIQEKIKELRGRKVPDEKIIILTFYTGQLNKLKNQIGREASIGIFTVDSFQGNQNSYILLSTVRTEHLGFLTDRRRLNVVISRAQTSLIIFGRESLLRKDQNWRKLINFCENSKIKQSVEELEDGEISSNRGETVGAKIAALKILIVYWIKELSHLKGKKVP